jgi:hypothetical protein
VSKPLLASAAERDPALSREQLERVSDALRGLQYGVVTVVVQDGVVVQIDRTEKLRITRSAQHT